MSEYMKRKLLFFMAVCIPLILAGCGQESATLKTGEPVPDFSLIDRQGKTWTLSQLRGQVVFINFWATWCPPCLNELPSMQKLFTTLPKDKFKMLAILSNDKPSLADFVTRQKGITIPVLDDASNLVGSTFFLTGLPETFIVDKQGVLRHKVIGAAQWDAPEYIRMIQHYIDE